MKDQAPVDKKYSHKACLFVAQIPRDCDEESLREHFAPFGEIVSVKLLKDRTVGRPYAFVQYQEEDDAEQALQEAAGSTLKGRTIRVEKARVNCTLFVAKLPKNLSNGGLREMFEEYGPVESVSIIKNHHTQKSKGCGFVKFCDREDAQTAFNELRANQRGIVVEWATSKNDPDALGVDKCNIFVGGLNPQLIEEDALKERFQAYGELESVTLVNRHASEETEEAKSSGAQRSAFAFLRYKDADASTHAIEQENGSEWLDRKIRVQYCESQEMKNKRRAAKNYPYGNFSNMNMYYPLMTPNQNGMVMMGGMAWYAPMYPGVDVGAPYNAPPSYPSPYAPWGFTPSYPPMGYAGEADYLNYPLGNPLPEAAAAVAGNGSGQENWG